MLNRACRLGQIVSLQHRGDALERVGKPLSLFNPPCRDMPTQIGPRAAVQIAEPQHQFANKLGFADARQRRWNVEWWKMRR
jgi:hypothetical protein